MRLESVRAFKEEIAAEVEDAPEAFYDALGLPQSRAVAEAFREATDRPMPLDLALGVAKRGQRGYKVAIRTGDPELAEAIADRTGGPTESDVRIIEVSARVTPAYLQGRVRPLIPGLSVGPASRSWAGTLGAFVRDSHALYALSNQHVVGEGDEVAMGEPIVQPAPIDGRVAKANIIGVADRYVPFSDMTPNLVDCRLVRLADVRFVAGGYTDALGRPIKGVKRLGPEDLHNEVVKIGRTTGVRKGRITAVEIDGLPVDMGDSFLLRFNDQVEVSGGPRTDFSAGGDSSSLIIEVASRMAIALLFAGGKDTTGEDFTYGNLLPNVLEALGVELVLS